MTDHPDFSAMSKDELASFAEVRGIEFDKRWGAAKLIAAIEEALAEQRASREALSDAVSAMPAPDEVFFGDMPEPASGDLTLSDEDATEWSRILDVPELAPAAPTAPENVGENKIAAPAVAKPKAGKMDREQIYDACVAWANGFARDIEHLDIEQDADTLSIRIVTKHGEAHGAVEGFEPTEAGLTEALALIRKQIG
jgi:hypothetical protein